MPVATTFRRTHLIDTLHPSYAGDVGLGINPKLLARIKASDLIVLIGGRLGEIPSQSYSLLDIPGPRQTLVHVHPGAEELGRVYHPHLAIHAAPTGFAAALEGLQPPNEISWRDADQGRARRLSRMDREGDAAARRASTSARSSSGCARICRTTPSSPPAPAISPPGCIASIASANSPPTSARCSGSMGYGVPSALGIKRAFPERTVVCFSGDGDFLMNGQEFATAVQYDLPVIVVIVRQRHLRHHPHAPGARISGARGRRPN